VANAQHLPARAPGRARVPAQPDQLRHIQPERRGPRHSRGNLPGAELEAARLIASPFGISLFATVSPGSPGGGDSEVAGAVRSASVIWGSSFLFIRVPVEHIPPAVVVFGRTALGAAFLVPLAARRQAFRGLRQLIVPVAVVTLLDMAVPAFLTAWESSTSVPR
jgi:hypothetical protein